MFCIYICIKNTNTRVDTNQKGNVQGRDFVEEEVVEDDKGVKIEDDSFYKGRDSIRFNFSVMQKCSKW